MTEEEIKETELKIKVIEEVREELYQILSIKEEGLKRILRYNNFKNNQLNKN